MHKCLCIYLKFMLNSCTLCLIHIFAAIVVYNIIVMFSSVWPYKAYTICNFQHSFHSFVFCISVYIYLFINVVGHHIKCLINQKPCRSRTVLRTVFSSKSPRKGNCKMISASIGNEDCKFVKFLQLMFFLYLLFSFISKT